MKSKIIGVAIVFLVDPELGDHKPFQVSGNADLTNLDDTITLVKLADQAFPLEQVQIALSAMAQADYEQSTDQEVHGINYNPIETLK